MKKRQEPTTCPCGSESSYEACCGRFHSHECVAPTALALMKSRYSAFVKLDAAYLLETWHATTRPQSLEFDEPIKWLGLKIEDFTELSDTEATVTFVARGKVNGRAFRQSEKSHFVKEDGRWYYVEGEF